MKTLKKFTAALAALCLIGSTQLASAGMISFNPVPATGTVGGNIFVELLWTGGPGDYIGDFDVDILFDPSIALPALIIPDPDMGLDSIGAGLYGAAGIAGGFNMFGVSLDSAAVLMANQDLLGNSFRLAAFVFTGVAEGQTTLTFGNTVFGDANGRPITPTLDTGLICVGPNGCADVPEPISIALLGIGLAGLGWSRRKPA